MDRKSKIKRGGGGIIHAALWLQLESFAPNPCAPRPTGRTAFESAVNQPGCI